MQLSSKIIESRNSRRSTQIFDEIFNNYQTQKKTGSLDIPKNININPENKKNPISNSRNSTKKNRENI